VLPEVTRITRKEPRYWGSWKGRVIKAIVQDGAKTWNDIREFTGLSQGSLNKALSELFDLSILEKRNGEYRVSLEIYKEYKEFFNKNRFYEEPVIDEIDEKIPVKFTERKQSELVRWIDQWREVKSLDFSLEPKHFFLEGRHLDDLSKSLISKAESEVLVVNPYVNQCDLSDTLREASNRGIKVRLITRPPADKKYQYKMKKQEYHTTLKKEGVTLTYNNKVHAKLIVVDRVVAIISSMNFYSGSSGGASWEAGLVSVEQTVVETIADSILELLERPETKKP
jgi:predicted transcriptional regulator